MVIGFPPLRAWAERDLRLVMESEVVVVVPVGVLAGASAERDPRLEMESEVVVVAPVGVLGVWAGALAERDQ
jgi:hypothetical protein